VVGGNYSTKLGYDALFGPRENDEVWWWKKLWKVKYPPNSILFMWLDLNNKVLTWEMLRKRNREGMIFVFYVQTMKKQLLIFFLPILTHNKFGGSLKVNWVSHTYGTRILLLVVFWLVH
jgi:hypothetical protein